MHPKERARGWHARARSSVGSRRDPPRSGGRADQGQPPRGQGYGWSIRVLGALLRPRSVRLRTPVQRFVLRYGIRAREPKVDHTNPPVASDQDVLRFDVAVYQPSRVSGLEPASRRDEQVQCLRKSLGSPSRVVCRPAGERATIDKFHRDERAAVVLANLVHGHNVWMGQASQGPRLAAEPTVFIAVGHAQDLQRNATINLAS